MVRTRARRGPLAEQGVVEENRVAPLWDNVLLRRDDPEKRTAGGIIIPDTGQELKCTGILVAKGSEVSDSIELGERFLVAKYPSIEFSIEDVTYFVLPERHLIARVADNAEIGSME